MKIQEQAPAKINLALDILGRRTDGFHELRMVMQSVSLCDTVTVEETGIGFALLADGFTVPAGKSSLEQQAAEAFFAAFGGGGVHAAACGGEMLPGGSRGLQKGVQDTRTCVPVSAVAH